MNLRENALAVLHYEKYEHVPAVNFGYWEETLEKWAGEGHITEEEAKGWRDGNEYDKSIAKKLGFDFNWYNCFSPITGLFPAFTPRVIETMENGMRKVMNKDGVVVLDKNDVVSIPAEISHTLVDRASWEAHYLPRLQYSAERIDWDALKGIAAPGDREIPLGLYCGSLFGQIRDWMGVEGISYLYADDEELYAEIISTVAGLEYRLAKAVLDTGASFDFCHFWEDICFKNGPLVVPGVFRELVGPGYKKISDLAASHGIDIVSLDCDGLIDSLIPVWLDNGVNTMFPIEVGTWNASIAPWRQKYGSGIHGVGGMNKNVFSQDYAAVDAEIERLRALVDLGGYLPCPDHRIAPDALWDNVRYYCDKFHETF